jgi:hypothetical protein
MKSFAWLLLAMAATAAEPVKLPLDVGTMKTRDGKVYEGAKITARDAVGVKIMHAGGVARVEYDRLPKELAARFPRDRNAAKEQLEKEAQQEAAHDRAVDRALDAKPAEESPDETVIESPLENIPKLEGDPEKRLMSLEAYARRIEDGIETARVAATEAEAEAKKLENSFSRTRRTSNGFAEFGPSKAERHRAEKKRAEAKLANQKIAVATTLLRDARAQIEMLKESLPK